MNPVPGRAAACAARCSPPAEPDLELQGTILPEQRPRVERAIGHAQLGQHLLDQRRLSEAQLVPGAAAVEAADRGGIGHGAC